ncbi:MAG: PAS domain-containing protein, partial [Planctomycetota bacterium]
MTQQHLPDNQADLLAGVLDSSLDGIYAFKSERDEAGQIVDFIFVVVNRSAEELVGRTAEQLLGQRMLDMLPGNKTDGLFDAYVKVVETGQPFVTEHYYEHDGLASWFSISATRYGDGFTVSFSDITEQKNASADLRLANERFELLVAGNASGVWDWDCATNAVYYSPVFNEMLGYEPNGLESTLEAFTSRLHPEDVARTWSQVEHHINKQGPYDVEYRLRHKEGHYVWCQAAGQAQWDEAGNPVRMAGSITDISKRKASEEHFRVLFEMSADAHLLFDDTGIIDLNQAAVNLLGYDHKQEMLNLHPAEMSPEFQPDGMRSMSKCVEMDQTAREKGFHRFDWMHRRKDGSDILVEVTLNPVNIKGRDALLVVWHDLTERVEAENAVREAVDCLNEAQELANIGNWQWTVVDNKITWSDQIKRMFGMSPDEPVPSFEEHRKQIHPDDVLYWESVLDKAAEDHQPYLMKFRIMRPDGGVRVLESHGQCVVNASGELVRTYGTVQDITEAETTRQQLEAKQHQLEFALQASHTGLWDWFVKEGSVFYSDTWYTMLGYEPGELPMESASWASLVHPDDLHRATRHMERYLSGQTHRYSCEIRMRNKAGDWQWIKATGEAAERDSDNSIARIVGLHVDIHKQKKAQQEIELARDQAQQASAAKSAFVANMSHEIRTPMNAILGYADLLLDGGQTEADKRNHAQTIRRSGKHLMGILNDILDLSKIEAGKMPIEQITCEPRELFESVINLMAPKAAKRGINLTYSIDSTVPKQIKSDPTRVRQVLINLIGNAIKFTDQGEVGLQVSLEPGEGERAILRCDVTDTGIGISDTQMASLFKPFSQGDESTTRKFGGTGLGLAISTNLCQMLGGELTCTSVLGQGSTFTATFVVHAAEKTDQVDGFNERIGLERVAHFPDL